MFFKLRGPRAVEMLQAPRYLNPAQLAGEVRADVGSFRHDGNEAVARRKRRKLKSNAEPEKLTFGKRRTPHEVVTKPDRALEAIRGELILTGHNFLHCRLHDEQEKSVQIFRKLPSLATQTSL